MKLLTLPEVLKALKKEGINISRRTFEFYQKIELLPKPQKKQKGEGGRGVYGLYYPTIIRQVKLIHKYKDKGYTLHRLSELLERIVIEDYKKVLKEWGFSDFSLSELKGVSSAEVKACDEKITREVTKEYAREYKERTGKEMTPEVFLYLQQSYTTEALLEKRILEEVKWWHSNKQIEFHALKYIDESAGDLIRGLVAAMYLVATEMRDDPENKTLLRLAQGIAKKIKEIHLLCAKVGLRLSEILGEYRGYKKDYYQKLLDGYNDLDVKTGKGSLKP